MKHGSLFSGIGGFDLAAEWMGWDNVFHCEINKFCQKILKYYWPNATLYENIATTDFTEWGGKIDIITGGFPCQPYSTAGKRKGKADDRHLWPEMLRAIREIQPTWILGENVPGLLNWQRGMVLAEIKADLEASGFEVFPPVILPACGKNAPHRRDRLWIIAYSKINSRYYDIRNERYQSQKIQKKRYNELIVASNPNINSESEIGGNNEEVCRLQNEKCETENSSIILGGNNFENNGITYNPLNPEFKGERKPIKPTTQKERIANSGGGWERFPTISPICGRNDGISNRVDRIKALGNAIVPQIAYEIFKAINDVENFHP